MIYHISDLHLDNPNLTKTRTKLGETFIPTLISNWNRKVCRDDMVIIEGDLGYNYGRIRETLLQLKGHKILVLGNHDLHWEQYPWSNNLFKEVVKQYTYCVPSIGTVLCTHKYLRDSDFRRDNSAIMLFGHTHTYLTHDKLNRYMRDSKAFNCCCDLNYFEPCSLAEIIINKPHHALVY